MKITELLKKQYNSEKLDEFLPVAAALGGAALRAAAPTLARGAASMLGRAVGSGAANTLGNVVKGVQAGTRLMKAANTVGNVISPAEKQQAMAQDNKLGQTLSSLQKTVAAAGGGNLNVNNLKKALQGTSDPNQAGKEVKPMLPAIAKALANPGSAELMRTALQKGVQQDTKAQADIEKQKSQELAKQAASI